MENNGHYPNPFDFVPFAKKPFLKSLAELDQMGNVISGYLELKIKALSPVHIAGYQTNNQNSRESIYYRQNKQPCIPAASIRGCLRAYIEALTNGWVSQVTPEYEYKYGTRHRGYKVFETNYGTNRHQFSTSKPAINSDFSPKSFSNEKMDIASYLFGLVLEKKDGEDTAHEELARKSKVSIEDAFFQEEDLIKEKYWLPDIQGDAIMGGAHPSASSWWYMKPSQVVRRVVNHGRFEMVEFMGEEYRGRKFYFHQDPLECIKQYLPETGFWEYDPEHGFIKVNLECITHEAVSQVFRIYLDQVPETLLRLLIKSLIPCNKIRHKIGFGKAYGYGSIEFSIIGAQLRKEHINQRIPDRLSDYKEIIEKWLSEKPNSLSEFINEDAYDWLAKILTWDHPTSLIFLYPQYRAGEFQTVIRYHDYENWQRENPGAPNAKKIAEDFYHQKTTLNFRYYQEKSNGWSIIQERKP